MSQRIIREIYNCLLLMSGLILVLYLIRVIASSTLDLGFIVLNLVLAWVPLGLSLALVKNLSTKRWLQRQNVLLSLGWLLFLPNTWYVLTDFVHVNPDSYQLFDIVFLTCLSLTGFTLGCISLSMIHKELARRFSARQAYLAVEGVILLSSLAIYLGRDLRWNSWDVILNPIGLVLDISDLIFAPLQHGRGYMIISLFLVLISVVYGIVWRVSQSAVSRK